MTKHSKKNKSYELSLLSNKKSNFVKETLFIITFIQHTNSLDFNFVHGVVGYKITTATSYYYIEHVMVTDILFN